MSQLEARPLPSFAHTIPFVSCSTVCCGTSRVIVFFGHELPEETGEMYRFLSRVLMGANSAAEGLKGEHYQYNKVAVVFPGDAPSHINFLFLQLDPRDHSLISNLECGNLSVGAAMMSLIEGVSVPDASGSVFATNLGTGQQMELFPHHPDRLWSCEWTVKFLKNVDHQKIFNRAHYETLHVEELGEVEYWIVEEGNVFFFVNAHPEVASSHLVDLLEKEGAKRAMALGLDPEKSDRAKIIFYSTGEANFVEPMVEACCFFKMELHNSLPGSGSMSLASFLTASLLVENGAPTPFGSLVFHVHHPSGVLDVSVEWASENGQLLITNTSFITPAKLLVHGKLAI
ncbi:MAG TPA: hypothetical protein VGB46_02760 [Flavisolibacter sp.]